MTVKEFIEILKQYPQDMLVATYVRDTFVLPQNIKTTESWVSTSDDYIKTTFVEIEF